MSLIRPLDQYVFVEWMKIFCRHGRRASRSCSSSSTSPITCRQYLTRDIPRADIALSYVYWMPESMFMVLPAAVLFATVFSIGSVHAPLRDHGGQGVGDQLLPVHRADPARRAARRGARPRAGRAGAGHQRAAQRAAAGEQGARAGPQRFNFAYAGEYGRVYKAQNLDVTAGHAWSGSRSSERGSGADYPTVLVSSASAKFDPKTGQAGRCGAGEMHVISDTTPSMVLSFGALDDRHMRERPVDLMAKPRDPHEMRYAELSRFIRALERSGGDANLLRVERTLKIAIPVTCLVIALFGAPLATSTQRGGTAYGIGLSLAITVIFLMLIQLTKPWAERASSGPTWRRGCRTCCSP